VDFRILGPFEATDDTGPVLLSGGKQKALLALLLLHADRVVSVDRLVDDLWGDDVPETAQKMVQIFVSHLRKQLPEQLLRTRAPGYVIELDGHSLDLRRFEELHAVGREALARGDAREAAAALTGALELWRGPALAEFEEPFARLEEARLGEQHLSCLEDRIEADLLLGRHVELVAELDALVRRHPLRERLRGDLMLALYRSGRHAEALDAFQSFRRMLDDEFGIDPSPQLKQLERRMLQQDASLEPVNEAALGAVAHRPAPIGGVRGRIVEPVTGRRRELSHLERLLEEAETGTRRLVFITGEAGIGKTTVVENLAAQAASATHTLVAHGQCVEHRGAGEPYLPVLEALGRLARQPNAQQLVPLLARQAPTWLAQMPWLLADDELDAVQRRLIGATPQRMLREMLETLEAISQDLTLVLVLEDLHWSDPSTVDLLDALARRREPARLLVVGTYRRGDAVLQEHPIHALARDLRGRGLCAEIAVGPLSQEAVADQLTARLGAVASPDVSALLQERTGGNPLFVTTLLDSWLEQGLLDDSTPDLARLSSDVPETVRELIEQMLEQLEPGDRELLAAASAVGQEFSVAALAAAVALPVPDVDARCDALARAGSFIEATGEERWPDGTQAGRYRFAHDLHREVLYGTLLSGRRAETHSRIGRRLEAAYGASSKEIAAQLAEQFVRAGDTERAVGALRLAAEQAFERLAHREAFAYLTTGLDLLERLPDGPARWSEELALQSMLGVAQIGIHGWSAAEAETALLRARELADRLDRSDDLGWAHFRLGTLYEVRGDYVRADPLLEQALVLSRPTESNGLLTDSHELLACSLFHQGVFDHALEHAELGVAAYDGQYFNPVTAAYGDNPGAACHSWAALSLWFLGYPDRARGRAREAVLLADDPRRRHGYATARAQAAVVEQCRLDFAATRTNAQAALEAASQDGYLYRQGMATILLGWALAGQGEHEQGISELEHGFALSRETGALMDDPYYFALLADACMRAKRIDAAWAAVQAGLGHAPAGRRFFFESELHRLAGQILLCLDRRDEAEERLRKAHDLARGQASPSLELRVALSLAGHLRDTGHTDEARGLVAGVYATFSEGFETHDLVLARELLAQLGA
jgi:DNA-binding SARP family transcriptional activator/predicted ATPase